MTVSVKTNFYTHNPWDYLPTGFEMFWRGSTVPEGWICEEGQILYRSEYPMLWRFALLNDLVVSEEDWNTHKMYGLFSDGETSDTFRLPDMRGLSTVGFETGYHVKRGQYVRDQIKNITGKSAGSVIWGAYAPSGAFYAAKNGYNNGKGGSGYAEYFSYLDASRVVPTGDRVQTRGVTGDWIIKYI